MLIGFVDKNGLCKPLRFAFTKMSPFPISSAQGHDDRVWVILNRLRQNGGNDLTAYVQRLCKMWYVGRIISSPASPISAATWKLWGASHSMSWIQWSGISVPYTETVVNK